jgi:hypothetical protein
VVWHQFYEYKKYVPDWDITPDATNSASKYWMWFMATYKHELTDHYKRELPDIPDSWNKITMDEAIKDLRTQVN